jgi:hypothetical protein
VVASSGRICDHLALYTVYIVRQEYTEGPNNMDGLTLSASFTDRGTDDFSSEFSLRFFVFGPSGCEAASGCPSEFRLRLFGSSDPESPESRNR